jgi:AcrR family transcriptional regulator
MAQVDEVGETLLRAAGAILTAEGAAALTVRRIAREAGVSTMNVYSRFGSKDGVVDRLYVDGFSLLRDAMAADTRADPIEDLRACRQSYRRFALEHPAYYAVMFGGVVPDHHPSTAAAEHATGTLALLADRLAAAMDRGALRRMDPMHAAAVVWATCHGVVSLEMKDVGPHVIDWSQVYDTACDAVLMGLTASASPSGPRAR